MSARLQLPSTDDEWTALVSTRHRQIGRFLFWAAEREATGSMRLSDRGDIARVRRITDAFGEPWWAAVVYSCFDSELGTLAVAQDFHDPVNAGHAARLLSEMKLPPGAIAGHRIQPAHKGAKVALVSACARAGDFGAILSARHGFHDRYLALRGLHAPQWGRTTCYDLLVRTGQLGIPSGSRYEPDRAYLADSTGPRKGFKLIWGIEVNRSNANECETLLRGWTRRWQRIADQVGVAWVGQPYGPGDFENALCIFQERGNPGYGITS
jgi:hypothetical protein